MPVNPKKSKPKPKAKSSKKKSKQSRPPVNRNTNSVRVHIINGDVDGGSAPPPYAGLDRSYFAFNPVFEIGLQKGSNQPPMNTGDPIFSTSFKLQVVFGTSDKNIEYRYEVDTGVDRY
jgi:hypothetical protein